MLDGFADGHIVAQTVEWLSKEGPDSQIIVCTGESMAEAISEAYYGVRATTFDIVHEQARLKSEYVCYANFDCEAWKWKLEKANRG